MSSTAEPRPPAAVLPRLRQDRRPLLDRAARACSRCVLALLVVAQVALVIRLNIWSADLFDALERRSTDRAMAQIGIFVLIMLGTMATNTAHLVVRRHLQLDWRRWLTARVIGDWMEDARHYQADLIPGDHANPDGRIAEDIRIATEVAIDLASTPVLLHPPAGDLRRHPVVAVGLDPRRGAGCARASRRCSPSAMPALGAVVAFLLGPAARARHRYAADAGGRVPLQPGARA